MYYLTWVLESHVRKVAEAVRDRIPKESYRAYGSCFYSLVQFKRISDRYDAYLRGSDSVGLSDGEISRPLRPELIVPESARWSHVMEPSRSILMALRVAARGIREANPGELVDGLYAGGGTSSSCHSRLHDEILRTMASYLESIDLGDGSLKRQQVGPGHSMYNARDGYVIPVHEAAGVFMEHLRIASPDSGQPLWRYMRFSRLKNLVENRALFFSRADKFDDEYEGLQPGINTIGGLVGLRREFTFINCWFQSSTESNVMWKSYAPSDGVLIRTSFSRLRTHLCPSDQPAYVGKVKYFNYETYFEDTKQIRAGALWDWKLGSLSLYFCKRIEYESENEVRVVMQYPIPDHPDCDPPASKGIEISVDQSKLIEKIIVNPQADEAFLEEVKHLLTNHGLNMGVEKSSLAQRPIVRQTRPVYIAAGEN